MHPQLQAQHRVVQPREQGEPELRHHAKRRGVVLGRDRDDAPEAELAESPRDARAASLRRDALAPPVRIDAPADLGVAGPDPVECRPSAADEVAARAFLDGELAEAVLVPVSLPAGERGLRVDRLPAEVADEALVAMPALEGFEVGWPEAAQDEPLGAEDELAQ